MHLFQVTRYIYREWVSSKDYYSTSNCGNAHSVVDPVGFVLCSLFPPQPQNICECSKISMNIQITNCPLQLV